MRTRHILEEFQKFKKNSAGRAKSKAKEEEERKIARRAADLCIEYRATVEIFGQDEYRKEDLAEAIKEMRLLALKQ